MTTHDYTCGFYFEVNLILEISDSVEKSNNTHFLENKDNMDRWIQNATEFISRRLEWANSIYKEGAIL